MRTKNNYPFLSVIIPAFDSKEFYGPLLKSLLGINYPNYEVIVVDDGSTDGSYEAIRQISFKDKKLKIIRTLKRRGIPGSRNLGIEVAQGEFVAFFDMDMEVSTNWPKDLIKFLLDNRNAGGAMPKVPDFHSRDLLQAAGFYIDPHTAWVVPRGYGDSDNGQFEEIIHIAIGAAGAVWRKTVLEEIGGFDESLGMFDDIDLGWRANILGWKTFYIPSAVIFHWTSKPWHHRPKSSSLKEQEFYMNNLIRVLVKNLELNNMIRYVPQYILIMGLRVIVNMVRGNVLPLIGAIRVVVWNLTNLSVTWKERIKIQSQRKVSDSLLFGSVLIRGNFLSIYIKHLRPILNLARLWPSLISRRRVAI